jgi:hypothetical protein
MMMIIQRLADSANARLHARRRGIAAACRARVGTCPLVHAGPRAASPSNARNIGPPACPRRHRAANETQVRAGRVTQPGMRLQVPAGGPSPSALRGPRPIPLALGIGPSADPRRCRARTEALRVCGSLNRTRRRPRARGAWAWPGQPEGQARSESLSRPELDRLEPDLPVNSIVACTHAGGIYA